ncbi:cysteine peptidase family C39 domain-containing protein [Microbispora sp. NPDC046933]|uniref:cysteine peptidase family C39 domain-containing protein n=1 Tax=Microbispora sp. NPDC046933 TaxID=3155618 RepID=UPI0034009167
MRLNRGRVPGGTVPVVVPVVHQRTPTECGPTCLAMVLGAYGHHVEVRELGEEMGVGRDGTSALTLLRAGPLVAVPARESVFRRSGQKASQLALAAELGFAIPETLISTDAFCPVIVQEMVPKRVELRVTIVGRRRLSVLSLRYPRPEAARAAAARLRDGGANPLASATAETLDHVRGRPPAPAVPRRTRPSGGERRTR